MKRERKRKKKEGKLEARRIKADDNKGKKRRKMEEDWLSLRCALKSMRVAWPVEESVSLCA